jgi:hypothetical protein
MYTRVLHDELIFPEERPVDQDTKSLLRGVCINSPSWRYAEADRAPFSSTSASATEPGAEAVRAEDQEAPVLLHDVRLSRPNHLQLLDANAVAIQFSDWDHVYHKRYIREPSALCSFICFVLMTVSFLLSSLHASDGPARRDRHTELRLRVPRYGTVSQWGGRDR